jgi:hypothetical protein
MCACFPSLFCPKKPSRVMLMKEGERNEKKGTTKGKKNNYFQ